MIINNTNKRNEILLSIFLLLLIPIWLGIAPDFYDWYDKEWHGVWFKRLYVLLDDRALINIPVCITILYLIYLWCRKIWKDRDYRYYRPIFPLIGLVVLNYKSRIVFSKIAWGIDYRCFMTILMIIPLLVIGIKLLYFLIRYIQKQRSKMNFSTAQNNSQRHGFPDQSSSISSISDNLEKYAKVIVDRLLATKIEKQSFALGVTGEWGVGKTTFLDELKKQIKGYADIVEFNPWMCSSPEQVTNDFFASLRHQLSPKYSSLSNPIREYARYIGNLTFTSQSWASDFILPSKKESLFEKKKLLSKQFSRLPRPVVVFIDDIDRLERDEVFEVLRLIRNTADLSNVIYIVAYDKEYVTCVLEEKNIKDSTAYLEKIFPVEVYLPKVEEQLIWKTLYDEIKKQCSISVNFTDILFSKFDSDDKELILKVLDNYRRAKRFAGLYMLNMAYLNQNSKEELKYLDVFWLELLQIYDKKSYDVLAYDTTTLLYRFGDRYRIKNGVIRSASDMESCKFSGEPFWRVETPKILEKMFGEYIKTIRQSICYTENYDKYFTLSVSSFRLSISEMKELFDTKNDPYVIVKKWIDGGKYFSSILYQLKHISIEKLDKDRLKLFVHGVLCFSMLITPYNSYNIIRNIKNLLSGKHYSDDLRKKINDIVYVWFKDEMLRGNGENLLKIGRLLHMLYVTICYNHEGKKEPFEGLIVSNDEIESLLVEVMKNYLVANPELSALEVLKENGGLAYMFKSCCVVVEDAMESLHYCNYKQLAYDVVIEHFESREDKPSFEEYEDAYGRLFSQELPINDIPDDEYEYWDYLNETYDNKMQAYFGSSYGNKENNKLAEFKNKCFVKARVEINVSGSETNAIKALEQKQVEKPKSEKKGRNKNKGGKKRR